MFKRFRDEVLTFEKNNVGHRVIYICFHLSPVSYSQCLLNIFVYCYCWCQAVFIKSSVSRLRAIYMLTRLRSFMKFSNKIKINFTKKNSELPLFNFVISLLPSFSSDEHLAGGHGHQKEVWYIEQKLPSFPDMTAPWSPEVCWKIFQKRFPFYFPLM